MSSVRQRDRAALASHLRFAAVAAATAWAAMWSWRGFTTMSATFIVQLVVVGFAVAGVGALARWRRLPAVVVVAAQVVVGGAVTCQVVAERPYPGDAFWTLLSDAVDAANTYAAPVPTTGSISVQPLLVVGGLVAMLLVDFCACTLRRVPLAGLPLLTVYSVPISLIDRGLSWWVFAATAAGFLALLYFQEEEHLARWGRSLDGSTAPGRRLSDSVRGTALAVGSIATAAAIVVPLAIPTLSFSVFDVGPGNGDDGDIEVTNPLVDLRQDLVQGDDIDLVTIRTSDPSPDHLRISVLNRYTDNEWSAGDRKVPTGNLAQGTLPPLTGVDPSIDFDEVDYQVDIADEFRSKWLPTQAPITSISADGDWRFDETTMDFLSSDGDLDTAGASYSMTAALPRYDVSQLLLLNTSPASAPEELTELPDDLPPEIEQLARQVTGGANTDFQRAVLLNQFFRDDDNFKYALPSDPGGGIGTGELTDFLDADSPTGRVGYCEQFAAAMGVMSRALGIPARVSVGFLAPTRVPGTDDEWAYSAHDLHAWVELYFPGAGWVLFDPTPAGPPATRSLPGYANAEIDNVDPTVAPETEDTVAPTSAPVRPRDEKPSVAPEEAADPTTSQDAGTSIPWLTIAIVLGVLLVLVLLALLPRSLRRRQRERRLGGGPESVWEELRATAVDLRLAWPEGRSPHETREIVVTWFGHVGGTDQRPARGPAMAPEAVEALDRVVAHLERLRYARRHSVEPGSLRDDVLLCCDSLVAGATPRTRRRAAWLPVSVLQRRRVEETDTDAPEPELVGGRSEVL